MQRLEVSCAVRHIRVYVVRRLRVKTVFFFTELLFQITMWGYTVSSDSFSARKRAPCTYAIHDVLQVTLRLLVTSLEPEKDAATNFALKKITGQLIFKYSNCNKCKDSCKRFCGSVGIVTRYELHSPGIESRWRRDFSHRSITALWPT
jgi:hypothetical protein